MFPNLRSHQPYHGQMLHAGFVVKGDDSLVLGGLDEISSSDMEGVLTIIARSRVSATTFYTSRHPPTTLLQGITSVDRQKPASRGQNSRAWRSRRRNLEKRRTGDRVEVVLVEDAGD